MANSHHHQRRNNEDRHRTNPWLYSIQLGFFAGLFFGILRWICYEMKFTILLPGYMLDSFFRHSFLETAWGYVIGIAGYIVFSIVMAILYKVVLGKLKGPWPGIFYGLAVWAILFGGIGPLIGIMGWLTQIGWNTIYTELCISTLWGVFIGYSIAFEFTDEVSREPMGAKN
ncbi:YqhR family membrane protein [Paenibacillus paeoniae]|uniref:DUF1440 domain-containing protein n=1 Tax=Paenibacillus paeoniae TaxID=2292705 RepID=A0A371PNV0_9BACL|nr:YqhR family membrane protein [Paenibacillus paeoniae]REK77359.1 hypothetical protein DX130_10265 [Paenibacillus paeoniae]